MAVSNRAGLVVLAAGAAVVTLALVAMSAVIANADSYGTHVISAASRAQELAHVAIPMRKSAAFTQKLADPTADNAQAYAKKVANLGLAGSLLSPKCRSHPPIGSLFCRREHGRLIVQRCIGANGQGDERVTVQ
jgi:hypothetical protein